MSWYYKEGDHEIGPVSKATLGELIKAKQINGATLVRNVAMDTWKPLAQMVKPKPSVPLQPPPPPGGQQAVPLPPDAPDNTETPFQFTGTGGEYFKIWIVNILLSIVTLGIYSAWAKVRRKQYFYGNTRVAGSALQAIWPTRSKY